MGRSVLRVEEPKAPALVIPAPAVAVDRSLDEWRKLAIQSGERLSYAETQLKDLRETCNELRARLTKSKDRQDSAQARANELQAALILVTAERDDLKAQVQPIEGLKRRVWAVLEDAQQAILQSSAPAGRE